MAEECDWIRQAHGNAINHLMEAAFKTGQQTIGLTIAESRGWDESPEMIKRIKKVRTTAEELAACEARAGGGTMRVSTVDTGSAQDEPAPRQAPAGRKPSEYNIFVGKCIKARGAGQAVKDRMKECAASWKEDRGEAILQFSAPDVSPPDVETRILLVLPECEPCDRALERVEPGSVEVVDCSTEDGEALLQALEEQGIDVGDVPTPVVERAGTFRRASLSEFIGGGA